MSGPTTLRLSSGEINEWDRARLAGMDLGHTRVRLHFYLRDVRVEIVGLKSVPPDKEPPERQDIREWTAKSRKRLLWLVNNSGVEWKTMLTVTYGKTWPIIGRTSQVHLANLIRSLKRQFPELLYLWVKEYQERGAQHFHVLLSIRPHEQPNMRYRHSDGTKGKGPWGWREWHKWVSRRWQESIKNFRSADGLKAGCRWELLEHADGGARYISQYAQKKEQKIVPEHAVLPGRWWGHSRAVAVKHGVPFVDISMSEYLDGVEGQAASPDGWIYSILHNGRERAHRWLPPTGPENPLLPTLE